MRRAERLFRLVQEMRSRELCRAEDLADVMEVSVRTIYRDIAHLQASGLPIEGAAGLGYLLRPGFDLPPMTFTRDQLEALALGLRFVEAAADADMALSASEVWSKIEAVLPEGRTSGLTDMPVFALRRARPTLNDARIIRAAIKDCQVLNISYTNEQELATNRSIWPLSLTVFTNGWMIAAWCELRQDFRAFRLDRISTLSPAGETFVPKEGRDLAAYLSLRIEQEQRDALPLKP